MNEPAVAASSRKRHVDQVSAGGVVYLEDQVLLISTAEGSRWQLPKGRIERGESPAQAAIREIREETGVSSRAVEPLGDVRYEYEGRGGVRVRKRVDFFLCTYVAGSTADYDPGEVSGAAWLEWSRAIDQLSFDSEREILRRGFERWIEREGQAATAAAARLDR